MYNAHPYFYINILVKKVCVIVEVLRYIYTSELTDNGSGMMSLVTRAQHMARFPDTLSTCWGVAIWWMLSTYR